MKLKNILAAIRNKLSRETKPERPFKYASIFTTYHDYGEVTDEDVEKVMALIEAWEHCEED